MHKKKQVEHEGNQLIAKSNQLVRYDNWVSNHLDRDYNQVREAEDERQYQEYQDRAMESISQNVREITEITQLIAPNVTNVIKTIVDEIKKDTTCVRTISLSFFCLIIHIPLWGKVKTVEDLERVIAEANQASLPTTEALLAPLKKRTERQYDGFFDIRFRTDATKKKLADWETRLERCCKPSTV